ncbi:hypothetical protein [Desulfolucanica intricata]|uniref:hypothetical protein n=1 Tax=Desulfolucanica intricata TaxID=1285191 RepID=UPI0013520A1A|nr:hypothetical protein [Desulfolucanica intricata]
MAESLENNVDNGFNFLEKKLVAANVPEIILNEVRKLWQCIIKNYGHIRPGHVSEWAAAVHYYLCRYYNSSLTQQRICDLYEVSLHTMRNRYKKIKDLNLIYPFPKGEIKLEENALIISSNIFYNQEWLTGEPAKSEEYHSKPDLKNKNDQVAAKKKLQLVQAKSISDKRWISIMNSCKKLILELYKEFDTIEIKHFINHIQMNMALAGYAFKKKDLEYTFGRLFQELELTAIKGKDPKKFVTLYNPSGKGEPFVYIEIPK